MKTLFLTSILLIFTIGSVFAQSEDEPYLFVSVTSADEEIQMMAMVLATQSLNQDINVRVLLCGEGGNLSLKEHQSRNFEPAGRSPQDLLKGLISNGVTVEVCGIFLPNREGITTDDLLDGIGAARPPEVAAFINRPNVKLFSY